MKQKVEGHQDVGVGKTVKGVRQPNAGWRRLGLLSRSITERHRQRILSELFLQKNADFLLYLWRFCVLLCFSTIIAALGLLANSTAVVIGAMLVAPFMDPILAAAAALVMNWPRRFLRSLFLVFCGAFVAFAMAYLISMLTPDVELASREVLSRTKPNLYDLGIAAAAGAAAVFTMIYRVNAAVPGVAVAVALLPPLAAAGIVAEQGLYDEFQGALLLFVTNFATILLVASISLLVHGFVPETVSINPKKIAGRGILLTLFFVVIISVPLVRQTNKLFHEIELEGMAYKALKQWYPGIFYHVHRVDADGSTIKIYITGPDFERDDKVLAQRISELAGESVWIEINWLITTTKKESHVYEAAQN
jgi:uncharacterized hydrophobic protein (TIGR00271 family)